MFFSIRLWARMGAAVAVSLSGLAWAQSVAPLADGAAPSSLLDPSQANAKVPPLRHASVFEGVRFLFQPDVGHWPQLNEQVRARGGWRVYAREAQATEPTASSPTASPTLKDKP